ncbi:MAG: NAD(P)/FAD-dependent oxidoreductase [Pirellulales bacterium]|nr:NAD(P)/FAD-dependent oxidoreductase [Pirellulales bacterium]
MKRESFDCVVLGAGPAGTAAAALVSDAGFRTLLVERDAMPRFHVGESLMPETYWPLKRLGVLERLKTSRHTPKHSVQFINHRGQESAPFYFHQHDPRDCSQTWQVVRGDFDQMLFENAAEKGADCRDRTRVAEVLFEDDSQTACGVRLVDADGQTSEVTSRVVMDATGQQSIIANRLGIRRENPDMKKGAIWSYYRGARRGEGLDAGATVILHTANKDSWFWFIPLADGITSVGVVGDTSYLFAARQTPEEIFARELALCPALCERLEASERVEPFRVAREFSYKSTQAAGNGWVLIGDAYGFIDPVYSSGVYFALKMGEMAADCVSEGLKSGVTTGSQLGGWSREFDAAATHMRKLVSAFYTPQFSIGKFIKAHPEHRGNLTDLLIGRVFHPEAGRIFEDMDKWLAAADSSETV